MFMLLYTQCAKSQVVRSSGTSFGHWLWLLRLVKHTAPICLSARLRAPYHCQWHKCPHEWPQHQEIRSVLQGIPCFRLPAERSTPGWTQMRCTHLHAKMVMVLHRNEYRSHLVLDINSCSQISDAMEPGAHQTHPFCILAEFCRHCVLWMWQLLLPTPIILLHMYLLLPLYEAAYCNSLLEEPLPSFGNCGTATGMGGWPVTVDVGPNELHVWDVLTGAQWGSTQVCLGAPFHRYFINTACHHICSKHVLWSR